MSSLCFNKEVNSAFNPIRPGGRGGGGGEGAFDARANFE